MHRHLVRRLFAGFIALGLATTALGVSTEAEAATPTQQAQPDAEQSYAVVVVKVVVREADGKVYRARTQAVRVGDDAQVEVLSDLHRHALKLDVRDARDVRFSYARDGGKRADGAFKAGSKVIHSDGHSIEVRVVPTKITVGVDRG